MTSLRPPTIALVAVHGVGDHGPGAAARAVADLLLRLRRDRGSRYTSFVEQSIRIPTAPARVNPRSSPNVAPDLRPSIFAEQHPFLRTQLQYGGAAARDREEDSPDHQLMRAQLAEYRSPGEPYDTVRLHGERFADSSDGRGAETEAHVHVYEMRWADLSRLKPGALRFFAELYQLLFHFAHLGRSALDHARLEYSTSLLWRAYGATHTWAVRLLTVVVPAVWVAMLAIIAGAAVLGLPPGVKPYVVAAGAGVLAGGAVAATAYQSRVGRALALWLPMPLAVTLAAFGVTSRVRDPVLNAVQRVITDELFVDRVLLGAWLLIAGWSVYAVFRRYERIRPGALAAALAAYVVAGVSVGSVVVSAGTDAELVDGTIHVFEAGAVAAAGVWSGLYLLGAVAGVLGIAACLRLRGGAQSRAWRASRTAAATLAVTTSSVLVVAFALWAALYQAFRGVMPTRPFVAAVPAFQHDGQTYTQFFERVLEATAGAGLPLLLLFLSVLAAVVALTLMPALFREVRPRRDREALGRRTSPNPEPRTPDRPVDTDLLWAAWERYRAEDDLSQRLGEWLTRGLRSLGAAALVLYVGVFFLTPAISVAYWMTGAAALAPLQTSASAIILATGGWLAAAVVGLVALHGPFGRFTLGFRTALDIALDVDNYLRTHPRDATPRARIAERYASLLRYLCHWRDSNGRPYDAIVIVSHSQGSVITADLLSFIQREEDPELDAIRRPLENGLPGAPGRRLFLFTMGSPLRQLYSEWFPHLFGWVRGETGDGLSRPLPTVPREPWMLLPRLEEGHRVSAPAIPDGAAPDPYALGIARWVNAYRSGDYVGRALWRHTLDGCDWVYRCAPADAATRFIGDVPPITYVSEDAHRSRRELCIGAGAHTHYWDATAKVIAVELDLLLADATKLAARVSKDTEAPAEGMES